jgi:hypothetical protein
MAGFYTIMLPWLWLAKPFAHNEMVKGKVDGCGLERLMTQDVSHIFECSALVHHLCCGGMSQ